jgi:hypothetical protein
MIEQAKELVAHGLERHPLLPLRTTTARAHLRAARASPRRPNGSSRRARRSATSRARHRLSPPAVGRRGGELLPEDAVGTLDFLEEPIRDETPEAYESLRKMTDVPFAIGEEFASKWQFLPYIERGIHQFNRIDVCNVGGSPRR